MKTGKCWLIAGCAAGMVILLMSSYRAASKPASAPNTYAARCAACGQESRIASDMVRHLSFARMHPQQFREEFPGIESPLGQQCAGCAVFHCDFALSVCPRSGKRFIVLRDADTPMPVTAEAIAAVSPF